ncbi:GNAT family N-acetyltransferase [Knoellia sp. p5-6-4]|uniref:GNAT family N-acetyltransferase n=1 Tax=unclassified Knoellia TaxID=2618719 RepID=UPI0023DAB0EA|nr:GNAT family N-acetyltransferase [Knoellia sp. p5-6-4]MDF2146715.1 GNAT family N-acetyltransferase [Knoellia sp. p5-6-4]
MAEGAGRLVTRLVSLADAPVLAELARTNREFMAPYEPFRSEEYYTVEGQRALVRGLLTLHAQDRSLPHVILDEDGTVVGRITLNEIVRGPLQSCSLGYWLAQEAGGRGLATAAVRHIVEVAFDDLRLHRIQAGTLVDNHRSQRVLVKSGFAQFGLARRYLKIAGDWRDHVLFELLNPVED